MHTLLMSTRIYIFYTSCNTSKVCVGCVDVFLYIPPALNLCNKNVEMLLKKEKVKEGILVNNIFIILIKRLLKRKAYNKGNL